MKEERAAISVNSPSSLYKYGTFAETVEDQIRGPDRRDGTKNIACHIITSRKKFGDYRYIPAVLLAFVARTARKAMKSLQILSVLGQPRG